MSRCGHLLVQTFLAWAILPHGFVDAASLRYRARHYLPKTGEQVDTHPILDAGNATGASSFFLKPGHTGVKEGKQKREGQEAPADRVYEGQCYVSEHAYAHNNQLAWCPTACPYRVEDPRTTDGFNFCNFQCVNSEDCDDVNPATPVSSPDVGMCRACHIEGCLTCKGRTTCATCHEGYFLDEFGKCRTNFWYAWLVVFAIVGAVVLVLVFWVLHLACRPVVNPGALRRGLHYRSRAKLQRISEQLVDSSRTTATMAVRTLMHGGRRMICQCEFWPLTTNLHTTEVAGPGLIVHMNFQAMLIIWAAVIALAWLAVAYTVDEDLLIVGTQAAVTPRMRCILIQWGHEIQVRLMWVKHGFCWFVYVGTTIMALLFAIYQRRQFQRRDHQPRMSHYAALCRGLPIQKGDTPLEQPLKEHLEKELGLQVMGVSMCWAYEDKYSEIIEALDISIEREREEWFQRHKQEQPAEVEVVEEGEEDVESRHKGTLHRTMESLERKMLGYESEEPAELKTVDELEKDVVPLLTGLSSGGMAFVVFNTEKDRDKAAEKVEEKGLKYLGCDLRFEIPEAEPSTVNWENMSRHDPANIRKWFVLGFLEIVVCLLLWVIFFYTPWAYFLLSSDYEDGTEPGPIRSFALSLVITAGNQIVYLVCADAAGRMRLRYSDNFEAAYMVFYFIAIMLQSLLDFYVTYHMAYDMMVGRDVRLYDGTPLEDAGSFLDVFQTYAMQRELGNQLYCYFASFVLPFVIEPFVIVLAPLIIGSWLVRSHAEISSHDAEKLLVGPPMDLSRYADNLVNVAVVVLVFYFPGGFILKLFLYLVALHCFIYAYDHYRILRNMQKFWYSNMDVEICTQYMFSAVCAIILSCSVFKMHSYEGHAHVSRWLIFTRCATAFVIHIVVHCLVLRFVVPLFDYKAQRDEEQRSVPYRETASRLAVSWFNANPVHCLRSQFIHAHHPYCVYCAPGKEHLLRVNEEAHLYYKQDRSEVEDYDLRNQLNQHLGHLRRKISKQWSSKKLDETEEEKTGK